MFPRFVLLFETQLVGLGPPTSAFEALNTPFFVSTSHRDSTTCIFLLAATPASPASTPASFQRVLPPLAGLKAVLFDVDGTLTDSDPLHFLAFKEILQEVIMAV